MAIINTQVAPSSTIREAALNLNAKAYEIRRTVAAVWDLKTASGRAPESAKPMDLRNPGSESVVGGGDERVRVPDEDFAPGGKYRSIVKIFSHHEFQPEGQYMMGTGWLISPDTLVTAGHCCYDWNYRYGRATEIKCYIGYKGRWAQNDPTVQFRSATRIVTTEGWIQNRGMKPADVGFVRVDKPFTGVTPFRFEETPRNGDLEIGVVGYPGDLKDEKNRENGAYMYEMFLPTRFDLATQPDCMLEYEIDTFGGNSGAPVLRKNDLVSIGAHVYGGPRNSASVIGKFGNPFNDYLAAFDLPIPNEGLNLVPVTGNTAIDAPVPKAYGSAIGVPAVITAPGAITLGTDEKFKLPTGLDGLDPKQDSERFLNTMLEIAGKPVPGGAAQGFLRGLIGAAINAIGKLAESSLSEPDVYAGAVERAILAEAALLAITELDLSEQVEESIFSDMRDAIKRIGPHLEDVLKIAVPAAHLVVEPALRLTLDSLSNPEAEGFFSDVGNFLDRATDRVTGPVKKAVDQTFNDARNTVREIKDAVQKVDQTLDQGARKLAAGTIAFAHAMNQQESLQEGFLGNISDLIRRDPFLTKGLTSLQDNLPRLADTVGQRLGQVGEIVQPGLTFVFRNAGDVLSRGLSSEGFLDDIDDAFRRIGGGINEACRRRVNASILGPGGPFSSGKRSRRRAEATMSGPANDHDDTTTTNTPEIPFKALAIRAIVADAALEALFKLNAQQLQTEGFMEFMGKQIAGPLQPVIKAASRPLLDSLAPLIGVVMSLTAPESISTGSNSVANGYSRVQNGTGDGKRRFDALRGSETGNTSSKRSRVEVY